MEKNKKTNKKTIWIVIVSIIIIATISAVLILFKDNLFKQKETFDNDLVIKRIDGNDSLKMPFKYSEIFLTAGSYFEEEILNLKISTVSFDISEAGISWGAVENVLVNTGDKNALDDLAGIKYCKGITDISTIISDKKRSSVIFYEGYSEEQYNDGNDYVIIPSSMSKYINEELSTDDKILTLRHSNYMGMFKIIGEYTTKDEYDTLYVSYANLVNLFDASSIYMSEYVDTLEIDINEEKDLTKLIEYLERYFADANMLDQYKGKTNMFDDFYLYKFVHSINTNPSSSETQVGTITELNPSQSEQPVINNEKNILTISRIDGGTDLNMSHIYADILINDYMTYSQYINDIVISTEVIGVDRYSIPLFTNYEMYGITVGWNGVSFDDIQLFVDVMFHQAVTSTSDIIKTKSDCEIKFYGDYTEKDLIMPREEDCNVFVKGYAIVPATFNNAFNQLSVEESKLLITYYSEELHDGGFPLIYSEFKPIGEYVTTDKYDTIYLTYVGYNDKYIIEPYKNEYIESIVIETKKDMDISPFIEYLEKYFAPSDNAEKYKGKNNELGIEYEFCYTMTEGIN